MQNIIAQPDLRQVAVDRVSYAVAVLDQNSRSNKDFGGALSLLGMATATTGIVGMSALGTAISAGVLAASPIMLPVGLFVAGVGTAALLIGEALKKIGENQSYQAYGIKTHLEGRGFSGRVAHMINREEAQLEKERSNNEKRIRKMHRTLGL